MKVLSFLLAFWIGALCQATCYGYPTVSEKGTCGPVGTTCAPPPTSGSPAIGSKNSKTARFSKYSVPDVEYPYSFTCPHCGMKITVVSAADWKNDCSRCVCGLNKLGCYYASKRTKS